MSPSDKRRERHEASEEPRNVRLYMSSENDDSWREAAFRVVST